MCVFKLYLGRILGPRHQCVGNVATLSAPLRLHLEKPRSQVGSVLMATPDLGSPAPYIPIFYQQCSSITLRANHEVSVCCVCMHLYMLMWRGNCMNLLLISHVLNVLYYFKLFCVNSVCIRVVVIKFLNGTWADSSVNSHYNYQGYLQVTSNELPSTLAWGT